MATPRPWRICFWATKQRWDTVGWAERAGVIWRYLEISCCDTMCCGCYLSESSPVQGLEGILDESDDEDEAENITEVDATRSDHLQIICRLFAVCQRCYEAVTGIVGAKKTGNRVRKLKRAKKAAWQKDGHSGKACCYFWYMWYHSCRVDSFHQGTDKDLNILSPV